MLQIGPWAGLMLPDLSAAERMLVCVRAGLALLSS